MGLILSKFYDKPSTKDTLEKIEQEIQNIEERRWTKIRKEQFAVQILTFLPITVLIANVCILIYPSDSSFREKLLLSVPITILNLILWLSKKLFQWYVRWSLDNEEIRLRKLQREKKKILEMVCETESYRVAAELLEKYDPKQLRRRERGPERPSSPFDRSLTNIAPSPVRTPQREQNSFINQSFTAPTTQRTNIVPSPPPPTPIITRTTEKVNNMTSNTSIPLNGVSHSVATSSVQGRPVRPILGKDRTLIDKVVDWVVSDGPENRFALICKFCHGHNGMSLAEEFETIKYRCCYCYNLNIPPDKLGNVINDKNSDDHQRTEDVSDEIKSKDTPTEKEEAEDSKRDNNNQREAFGGVKSTTERGSASKEPVSEATK